MGARGVNKRIKPRNKADKPVFFFFFLIGLIIIKKKTFLPGIIQEGDKAIERSQQQKKRYTEIYIYRDIYTEIYILRYILGYRIRIKIDFITLALSILFIRVLKINKLKGEKKRKEKRNVCGILGLFSYLLAFPESQLFFFFVQLTFFIISLYIIFPQLIFYLLL